MTKVASTSTLEPNPDAPEEEVPAGTSDSSETSSEAPPEEAAPRRRRRRRTTTAEAPAIHVPKVAGEVHLAALGRLVLEANKHGLSVSEYAEQHLVPMVEAYALYESTQPQTQDS